MAKVAVLMAEGYEEGETLSIVDILRRAGIECRTVSFGNEFVKGMHNMYIKADEQWSDAIFDCDAVVLPGGRPGGENLKNNPDVIRMVQRFNETPGKYIAAICSGTTVLAQAQVIQGKRVTGYTGYAAKLPGAVFCEDVVVADQNLITSQGPATPYPFAYKIAEILGKGAEAKALKEGMMYTFAGGR